MKVDDGLAAHKALADDDGIALLLQQLVQAGVGAVLHGVAVTDEGFILRQAAVGDGLLVGGDPLPGGGQAGQAADDADALGALAGQPADAAVNGAEVGHADGGVLFHIKGPVHQHHRKAGGNEGIEPLEIIHGAGDEQPIHQTGGQQADVVLLPVHVLLGVGDDEVIAMGRQAGLHRLDHGGEKFIGDIGHDKAHGLFLAGAEAAGGGIRRIAQLRDSPVHLFLCLAGNIAGIVDGVGHRGGGDPRQFGHVTDRHFHWLFPLRNRFSPYVIHFSFSIRPPFSFVKHFSPYFAATLSKSTFFLSKITI